MEEFRKQVPYVKYVPSRFASDAAREPLRGRNEYEASECVTSMATLMSPLASAGAVRVIDLCNVGLNAKELRDLPAAINRCAGAQMLLLRNCGLRSVDGLRLPQLQVCNLASNEIADVKGIARLVLASPMLESLDIRGNPCASKPQVRERLAACSSTLALRELDGTELSVAERLAGIGAFGDKRQRQELEPLRFDLSFSRLPAVTSMRTWTPDTIVDVDLRRCDLALFHVGGLRCLRRLRLSHNRLTNVRGMGLERCDRLRRLDLDNNALAKKENVRVFSLMPRLVHLSLFGNAGLGDYRLLVVATTMFLAGDNRNPGLVSLDNRSISIDERVAAAEMLPLKKGDMPPEHQRWRYLLIKHFGHKQLRVRQFAEAIKVCSFRSAKLTVVQLAMFKQLAVLDLKHNNLVDVPGLDGLPGLKLLNLTNNPKLNLAGVLQDLRKTTALEQVFFAVLDVEGHKRARGAHKYVASVVTALFDHTQLRFLDSDPLPPQMRVEAYAARGASPQEAEHYRWRLALNASCTLGFNRQHHPQFVDIGAQYDASQITALRRMGGYGLRSGVVDLSMFAMLQQLSLANNSLSTTVGLGLERLHELRRLELHDNEIRQPVGELAALFDRLEQLEIVTLRNNPVMRAPDARARLIGALVSQRRVATTLRVIDTPITVAERCDAWQAHGGGSASDVATLREPALLALRCPLVDERATLTVLDLSDAKLEQIDVRQFPALVHLSLAGNALVALARIVGLLDLSQLRSLNLQRNQLASIDEVIRLLSSLMLYSIGLAHNPLADPKRPWRTRIIAGLPALTSGGCVLRRIDDQLLTSAEICGAHAKLVGRDEEPDAFRYRVAMLRQVPLDASVGELVELDLSHCDLKFKCADLSVLRSIKRLSLAHNQMHPKHMPLCNVVRLKTLEELDLSHNQLSLIKMLGALIERLPQLKAFAFDHNPCHPMAGIEQPRVAALLSSAPRLLSVASQLKRINGVALPDALRVAVAARELGRGVGEQLAADLAVAEVGASCIILDLSKRNLCVMSPLTRLRHLTALLLTNNALHSLAPNLLEPLPVLRKLDLRYNQLPSLDAIVEVVLGGKALQSLYILEATADRRATLVVEAFAPRVLSAVPTLMHVDGFANQRPVPRPVPRDMPMLSPADGDDDGDDGGAAGVEDSMRQPATAPYQDAWADRYMRRYSAKPGFQHDAAAASARFSAMAGDDDLFAFGAESDVNGVSGVNASALSGAVYGDEFVPNFASAPPSDDAVPVRAAPEPIEVPDDDDDDDVAAAVEDDVASIDRESSSGSPPPPPSAADDDEDNNDNEAVSSANVDDYLPKNFRKSVYGLSVNDAMVNRRDSHQHDQIVDAVDAVEVMQVPDSVVEIDDDDGGTPVYLTNYGRLPVDFARAASPPPSDALPELPRRPQLTHAVSMAVIGTELPPLPSVPAQANRLVLPELPVEARLALPTVPVLELSDDDRDLAEVHISDDDGDYLPSVDAAAMFPDDDDDDDDGSAAVEVVAPVLLDVPDDLGMIGDSGRASLSASSSSSLELIDFGAAFDDVQQ